MSLDRQVNLMSVENNPADLERIKKVYSGNLRASKRRFDLVFPKEVTAYDNAKSALHHMFMSSIDCEPVNIALIDRDLEFKEEVYNMVVSEIATSTPSSDDPNSELPIFEKAVDPGTDGTELVNLIERGDPEERRDGVELLTSYQESAGLFGVQYSPIDIAIFYTAEPDIVRSSSRFNKTLIPAMNEGVGSIIFIQAKKDDPNNELVDVYEAAFTTYQMLLDTPGWESMDKESKRERKVEIAGLVSSCNYDPTKFLEIYGNQ